METPFAYCQSNQIFLLLQQLQVLLASILPIPTAEAFLSAGESQKGSLSEVEKQQ